MMGLPGVQGSAGPPGVTQLGGFSQCQAAEASALYPSAPPPALSSSPGEAWLPPSCPVAEPGDVLEAFSYPTLYSPCAQGFLMCHVHSLSIIVNLFSPFNLINL